MHFRACAEQTSSYDVTSGHVISCHVISGQGPSGDVTSSNAIRKVPLLFAPPKYALSCTDILL
jgi:hypothetical protein